MTLSKLCRTVLLVGVALAPVLGASTALAQCRFYILIDGQRILVDGEASAEGLKLPAWLKAGQTLAADLNVHSISVIEFTENGTKLEYSRVVSVSALQTVPASKVWKMESIFKKPTFVNIGQDITFSTAGTFQWAVPACINYICVEVWGGGGGSGGYGYSSGCATPYAGGGGAGGGYGQQCFSVTPGTVYAVTVAAGGGAGSPTVCNGPGTSGSPGGNSSVGALISATGGAGGNGGTNAAQGTGGSPGGSSTATVNVTGANGSGLIGGQGANNVSVGGLVGNGGNGVGAGQPGRVIITW